MKKTKLLVISILCIVLTMLFFACANVEQTVEYTNVIKTRYADSFEILSSYEAQDNAIEYKDVERVSKKILIDTRIAGNHTLGLYIPKGEEIEVIIEEGEIGNNNEIIINDNLDNQKIVVLENLSTKINHSEGGILEFNYKGQNDSSNCTKIVVKGAIDGNLYRYGIDKNENINTYGPYVTFDAANVRIYANKDAIGNVSDVQNTMKWWQNTISFMDKIYGLSFYDNNFSPVRIYLTKDIFSFDVDKNIIYIPSNLASSVLNFKAVSSGDDAKLVEVIRQISRLKIGQSYISSKLTDLNAAAEMISAVTYAKFVDSFAANDNEKHYVLSQAECLDIAINGTSLSEMQKNISLIMFLYYEFGEDVLIDGLNASLDDVNGVEDIVFEISKIAKVNTYELLELYNLHQLLSQEQIDQLREFEDINLVANRFAAGAYNNPIQSGLHFKIGQTETIDFKEGLVTNDPNWYVDSLEGANWKYVGDGKYSYTPSYQTLNDTYSICLKNGEKEKVLKGNITVDIDVANYSLYSNIKYDTQSTDKLNDAIKATAQQTPSFKQSLFEARVPKEEEVDTTAYSLAITKGCMQVPEDDKYVFYLTSSGLCKVVFGVEDHNFTMFENSLTVGEYTEELKYEISLQKGYKYYYTIYVLSNKGSGYANLGIKSINDESVNSLDRKYLISDNKKLSRDDIVVFNPQINLNAYTIQAEVDKKIDIKQIRENPQHLNIEQKSNTLNISKENLTENARFILPLITSSEINYFKINTQDMAGVRIKVTASADFSNILVDEILVDGENYFIIEDEKYISEMKVEFISESAYNVKVLDLEVGEKIKEMEIVPSSSTDIEYIGEWSTSHKYIGMNNSVTQSSSSLSSISYKFNGDAISMYAAKDVNFGSATIYIDGQEKGSIDFAAATQECAQLIFNTKLTPGDHVIEIKANGDSPITLDYFAVSKLGETKVKNDFSKLWYVVFIPALVLIAGIVCISLDIKEKKKRKNSNN